MSEKSSHNDAAGSDDASSSSEYSQGKNEQPKQAQPLMPAPVEGQRRRAENEEPWTLPFASPFQQFQMPHNQFPPVQSLPNFNLNKPDNLFEEYAELLPAADQRRQSNPFRKVSGPIDMLGACQEASHDDEAMQVVQGTQNQQLKQQSTGMQYSQNVQTQVPIYRFPTFQMPQMPIQLKNAPPQWYNPNLMPQSMQRPQYPFFNPQMYPQFQFLPPNQQTTMEAPQFTNNISIVSKELQSKVFLIVQQVSVSSFQCNCKKSKCLKLYCECFANGQVCSQSCNCLDCKNRIDNPQERQKAIEEALIRNNDAFNSILNGKNAAAYPAPVATDQVPFKAPQKVCDEVIYQDEKLSQTKNSIQNRVRKGCNCKKSNCKKKYCECFSAGLPCSELCKCENCYNRKDGDEPRNLKEEEDAKEQGPEEQIKKVRVKKIKKEDSDQLDNKIQIKKEVWGKKGKKSL